MKLRWSIVITVLSLTVLGGCTLPVGMDPPQKIEAANLPQHSYKAGLYLPQELKNSIYVIQTSPVDKISIAIGDQTCKIFAINLPSVFTEVVQVDSKTPTENIDVVIEPSIVKFEQKAPFPAYNPYEATMTYHVDVYDKTGEKIFAQTTVGNAQSSKGLMSGFSARGIYASVAQMAMNDSARQVMEGLAEAEELKKP